MQPDRSSFPSRCKKKPSPPPLTPIPEALLSERALDLDVTVGAPDSVLLANDFAVEGVLPDRAGEFVR